MNIAFVRVYEKYNDIFIEVCYEKDYKRRLNTFVGMENVPKTVKNYMDKAVVKYQYDGSAMSLNRKTFYVNNTAYNETLYMRKETT